MSAKSKLSLDDLDNVIDGLVKELTRELRIWAKKSAWPEKVRDALSVKYENGNIIIDKPEEVKDEVDSLEYGGGSGIYVMPNAVIRPFIYRAKTIVDNAIAESVMEKIADSGGVWA